MTASYSAPILAATAPKSTARIPELDGLRGLAIALVITCHYLGAAGKGDLVRWLRDLFTLTAVGWSGVDLFFVLSGFLIGGILLDARRSPSYFRTFYLRRVFRILPIYYLWILLYSLLVAGLLWFAPGRHAVTRQDLLQVPIELLFLRNVIIGGMPPLALAWFMVTWSLAVEEQFYLVAPPLIRFVSVRHLVMALAATISLAPVLRFLIFQSRFHMAAFFIMPCRADGLAAGMLIAIAWRQPWFKPYLQAHSALLQRILFALLLGFSALLWWLIHPMNVVWITIGLTWMVFLWSGLLLFLLSHTHTWLAGAMRWRWLRFLGTISYCAYLIHDAFNHLAHRILLHDDPQVYNLQGGAVTLLALVLTISVASFSWRYFEQPLIRRGHGYSYSESAAASLASPGSPSPSSVLDPGAVSFPEAPRP